MTADLDVIVIGGGPSGLMAALSASQGTPFWSSSPGTFGRVHVLAEHVKPGGIAAYGTLSITNGWVLKGGQLKMMLLDQLRDLPVEIKTGAAATRMRREGKRFAVDVGARTFRAPAIVIACGIFSHLRYLKFSNVVFLAETLPGQNAFVSRANRVAESGAFASNRVLVAGSHASLEDTAARFRAQSTALDVVTVVDSRHDRTAGRLERRLGDGRVSKDAVLKRLTKRLSETPWNSGDAGVHTEYLAVVFDYNTYKLRPENAVRLVRGTRVAEKDGYVVADHWGRTSVPGIWACGNATFPLSGILQALYTGFVAGLSARSATRLAGHDDANGFLPWLAVPNSAWQGWLGSARELFSRNGRKSAR